MKVGDLVRFRSTGHLATIIERCTVTRDFKLFVHGDALEDWEADGIVYYGIEKLRSIAEKVS